MIITISFNTLNQEAMTAGVFEKQLTLRSWQNFVNFPDTYVKEFNDSLTENEIKSKIIEDVNSAAVKADWRHLPYFYTISKSMLVQLIS